MNACRDILIVCGYSGAGKSVALKSLADLGYDAIDNIPLGAVEAVVRDPNAAETPMAICLDVRTRAFSPEALLEVRDRLAGIPELSVRLLFLACDPAVLQRRFTETRHRHPLSEDRPVEDGIGAEIALLTNVRDMADETIDTTDLAQHELRRLLAERYGQGDRAARLTIHLVSFSYRRGLPRDADMVIDVRFLSNPHYVDTLRPHDGREAVVQQYVKDDPSFPAFFESLQGMVASLLPLYLKEGKSYFTLAIGCTGGKHRSVTVAEALKESLGERKIDVILRHRELT